MKDLDLFYCWLDASAFYFDERKEARQKYLAIFNKQPLEAERLIPDVEAAEKECFGAPIVSLSIRGYAPGSYAGTCCFCTKEFVGDKRAAVCLPCALEK